MGSKGGFAVGGFTPGYHACEENDGSAKKMYAIHQAGQATKYVFATNEDRALLAHPANSKTAAEMLAFIKDDLEVDLTSMSYVVTLPPE